ncbi:hypothetical protein [Aeromonas caviae]
MLAKFVCGQGKGIGGLFHQLHYLVLAVGEGVDAARQNGELIPYREEVEPEGEIAVRHRLQCLVGGVERPRDKGHQIVGDEGQQGGQHRDDGQGSALAIPEGVVTRIQGAGDDARLTCAGAIAIDVSLLAKAGGGARREYEIRGQGKGRLLAHQLGRGLDPPF